VAEDAVTPVHLWQLGCVQIAAADIAHVHFDQDLIGPQRRARPSWSAIRPSSVSTTAGIVIVSPQS
jgi:hypothetical protein